MCATPEPSDFVRVPGLFRRWDLAALLEPGHAYRIEDAGQTEDGAPLLALYRWQTRPEGRIHA